MQTPEERVKAAVLDAMQNEYDYEQVIGWVDDAWMDQELARRRAGSEGDE